MSSYSSEKSSLEWEIGFYKIFIRSWFCFGPWILESLSIAVVGLGGSRFCFGVDDEGKKVLMVRQFLPCRNF